MNSEPIVVPFFYFRQLFHMVFTTMRDALNTVTFSINGNEYSAFIIVVALMVVNMLIFFLWDEGDDD